MLMIDTNLPLMKHAREKGIAPRCLRLGRSGHSSATGFSLVELMIALVLSLFLIGGVTVTFLAARATATEAETLSRVQENVRFASDYLIRDLRNAGFRDQLTLTFEQFEQIGEGYAAYGGANNTDRSQIIVRYAGRGTCGQVFSTQPELKIIENRYFVADGDLRCQGTTIDDELEVTISPTVTLASGIANMRFQFLDADGNSIDDVCDFSDNDALDDACIGVMVQLSFTGQPDRTVEKFAAFRNVILDRLYGRD